MYKIKTYIPALLFILNVNIEQASPIDNSLLNQLCFKIASNKAFRACYKIGKISTIVGIAYLFLRYLNNHRNLSHNSLIQYTPGDEHRQGTLNIHTDGHVAIHCHDNGFAIQTERQDPDSQDYSLSQEPGQIQQAQQHSFLTLLQNFWQWLIHPTNRAIVRHVISIPRTAKIVLTKYAGEVAITGITPILVKGAPTYAITDHTKQCSIKIDGNIIQPTQLEQI